MRSLSILLLGLLMLANPVTARDVRPPERGGMTKSLGIPKLYKWNLGFSSGMYNPKNTKTLATQWELGVYKDLMNPSYGALGLKISGYIGHRDIEFDGGVRGLIMSPAARFAVGVDYNFKDEEADFILTLMHPLRRGGLFSTGGLVCLNWLPGRGHSWSLGLSIPLGQPNRGKTRPRRGHVSLTAPKPPPVPYVNKEPTLDDALKNVRETMHWINILTTPYIDQNDLKEFEKGIQELKAHLTSTSSLFPDGRSSEAEVRFYHQELNRAFSIAVSDSPLKAGESTPLGERIASQAKEIILEEIVLPYDRLLGQTKKEDSVLEFAALARGAFARWLLTSSVVPEDRFFAVGYVYEKLVNFIEENRELSRKKWRKSAWVWIPLQYALLPEQHDSQDEMDAILERAAGEKFTEGNRIWYVINEQFQHEMGRMIHLAEDYHVLWIHDFRGIDANGDPDEMAFYQVRDSYFAAMINRVKHYNETGKFPVYMIFLDQIYYEANKGKVWMELLQNPLDHKLDLPRKFEYMEKDIVKVQEELREAVANSRLLQTEAMQYGQEWLKNMIKVHVNITNPSDPSFWTNQILPLIGLPDNTMRDHRKTSFYDITEEDPYKGMAIYTGMGVGGHYAGATWEDRAIMAQGPAVLSLKYSARQLLLNQGFEEHEIPYPLQIRPKPANYEKTVENTRINDRKKYKLPPAGFGTPPRAFQIHNHTGYGNKPISVVKAVLYNLMPKGSVIKIPDSLWNSPLLAALLIGNALRGGRTLFISPSIECAPSAGFPQMSRAQELMTRLIIIQDEMSEELDAAGGMLKTGIYDPQVDVADLEGEVKAVSACLKANPWLKKLYGFDSSVYVMLDRAGEILEEKGFKSEYIIKDRPLIRPKLHMKVNYFASGGAWTNLVARPEWGPLLERYIIERAHQLGVRDEETERRDVRDMSDALAAIAVPMLISMMEEMSPEEVEGIIAYLTVGSPNMNYRSLMTDGEVMLVANKIHTMLGLLDLIFVVGKTTWVNDLDTLNELLPPYGNVKRRIGRFIDIML